MRQIRRILSSVVLAATLSAPGWSALHLSANPAAGPAPDRTRAVTIDNFRFSPQVLEIPAGTEVIWTNRDDVPHVILSTIKKQFASAALDTDDAFRFTFKEAGTYEYYCAMHPRMTGKILVR